MAQEMLSLIKKNSFFILLTFILFSYSNNISSNEFSYKDFLNNLSSFKSKFKQNLFDKEGNLIQKSYGFINYKKSKKFKIEYIMPNKITIISDGDFITSYDHELSQAIISSLDKSNAFLVYLTDNEYIENNFNYKITAKPEYLKIHFKHKENVVSSGLNSFFLKIKDYNILQISFINDIDQEVVMDISNFERNVSIKDSNFKFKIPNNADVLLNN